MLHAKHKRNIIQVIPFGIIWLIFTIVYSFLEVGILGDFGYYPATGNAYDFKTTFLYGSIVSFLMGLFQGWVEVAWLRKRFEHRPLWVKILLKTTFYLIFIVLFLIGFSMIGNSLNLGVSVFDPSVLESVQIFINEFSFWSVVIYIALMLNTALFFSEIGEYLGSEVQYNFLLGKYHTPKQETRIFMFLDMKSSTTIAEKMGHKLYFELIKKYYADMTNAILETAGEIYQYVGDEIVVSWSEKKGIYKNNCIQCFKKIKDTLEGKEAEYVQAFGMAPDFKAGYHIGEVTTGEIGIIKRDIIYTGDVLNTTARIQGECNTYNAKVLISEKLAQKLSKEQGFIYSKIGKLLLRGKTESIQLLSISFLT